MLITIIVPILKDAQARGWSLAFIAIDWQVTGATLIAAVGLLCAKDHNATGGQADATAAQPDDPRQVKLPFDGSKTLLAILMCGALLLFTGCAHQVTTAHSETTRTDTNGVEEVEIKDLRASSTEFWDSKNSADKIRASNGKATQSIGETGINGEASGTNAVNALKELRGIMEALPKF